MTSPTAPAPAPRPTLREQLRRAWQRLRGGELTPARAARSVALGLFVGVQPLPGLHLPIVVGVAVPLRLDAALAYLAANISIPPVAPFLWLGAIQLGSLILRGRTLPLSAAGARALVERGPGPLLGSLAVGAVALGVALALVGGAITYLVARALARRRAARAAPDAAADAASTAASAAPSGDDPIERAIARTAERFARAAHSRGTYYYVRGKLRGDPATRAVASLAPLGEVLDLGCGRGQLAVLLLEAGAARRVRGLDWDGAKLDVADRAAEGLDATFSCGDVRDAGAGDGDADTVLLVDVLHYFDAATQDALLERAAARVRPGGRLVVRDADRGRGWRSAVTLLFEAVGTAVRFNRGERVRFRDVERELVPPLRALGFACEVTPCWGGTPFANVLLVARRPPRVAPTRTPQLSPGEAPRT